MLQLGGLKSGAKSSRSPDLEGYETGAELYIYMRDTVSYGHYLDLITFGGGNLANPCYISCTFIPGEAAKLKNIHYGELSVSTCGNSQ